jgi:hypothetical protein
MARVLISYRREDTAGHAGHLYDILVEHFGSAQVFRDVDTIAPGDDFVEIIEKSISTADVLVALIGREWLSAANPDGRRRLDDPDDFVRLELGKALERNVRVVPVLVQGATMPAAKDLPEPLRALARRNAFTISDQAFRRDASALVDALQRAISPSATPAAGVGRALTSKRGIIVAAALVSVVIGVFAVRELGRRGDGAVVQPPEPKTEAPPPVATAPLAVTPSPAPVERPAPAPPRASPPASPPISAPVAPASPPEQEPAKPPIVLYPEHGSTIPQPFTRPWVFQWAPGRPGQAATYDVSLGRVGMTREPYRTTTTETRWNPKLCGIAGPAVRGWWLKVKATFSDGSTTETESYFNVVAPVDFAEYCRGCPDYPNCVGKPAAPSRPSAR